MSPDPTVYFIQEPAPGRDVTSALRYGRVYNIFELEDTPSLHPRRAQERLLDVLRDFDPKRDYICNPGGDPGLPLLVGLVLGELGFDSFRYLRWERLRDARSQGVYRPVTVPILTTGEVAA